MNISNFLGELEKKGLENDSKEKEKKKKYLNITKNTGEFLSILIKMANPKKILEVGTSNGYSTIWIASSAVFAKKIITLEMSPDKFEEAKINFQKTNLDQKITQVMLDASKYLNEVDDKFDLIFLDANRAEYVNYADKIVKLLNPGGVLVCDNAISHAEELSKFFNIIKQKTKLLTYLFPIGKGQFVVFKKDE
jgi:predicted O-methyltransferase YrrM